MRRVLGFALFTVFTFITARTAIADSNGTITQIAVIGDVVFFTAGSHTGKPTCSTIGDEWAFSLTTPGGRGMYALLLTAQLRGLPVTVNGSGSCPAWGDREAPLSISMFPA